MHGSRNKSHSPRKCSRLRKGCVPESTLFVSLRYVNIISLLLYKSLQFLQTFIGQVVGSAVGSKVFLQHGWRANGALMCAFCAFQLAIMLSRGPHVKRYTWFGYEGGLNWRKRDHVSASTVVEDRDSEKGDIDTREVKLE